MTRTNKIWLAADVGGLACMLVGCVTVFVRGGDMVPWFLAALLALRVLAQDYHTFAIEDILARDDEFLRKAQGRLP